MSLPGTDGGGVWVGDGVEAFDILEMKIVYESYNSTMVFMNVTFDKFHNLYVSQGCTVFSTVLLSV